MPLSTPALQVARGFAMGAADIVPGVSGGTVALVLGIYERLIRNVHQVASTARHLLQANLAGARDHLRRVEWLWMLSLLVGILSAAVALSSLIEHLLEEAPVRMAGLFFGLVLGSVVVAARLITRLGGREVLLSLVTAAALFVLLGVRSDTEASGAEVVTAPLWAFFLAGAIAICAMILPGISGSFILVMLGMYTEVLGAVNDRDLAVLGVFALGCIAGLGAFSTLLNWLLVHHHDPVIAAMIGLMLGSLRVLWPWPSGTRTTTLALPAEDVAVPILLAAVGFVVVVSIELVANAAERRQAAAVR